MKRYFFIFLFFVISCKSFSQRRIDANEVPQHIGDSVIVIGKVVSATYSQMYNAILFQIEQPNQQSFDVLIKSEDKKRFTFSSESAFVNKFVRVVGKIISSNGRKQIYIASESQFVAILGE